MARDTVELETLFYGFPGDGVAVLTLNRPDFGNGVVPEMARDLQAAFDDLEGDLDIRAIVLTGAGRQFCAGADLKALQKYLDERLHIEQEPFNARVLFSITQRITTSRLPFVAAINGGATAGGLDLALACDIRIASSVAKLGETYIKMGLAPGNGGTYFLPRLVGSGMAAELALTGDIVSAARALEIGLVNRVVEPDELLDASIQLAEKLASRPRKAIEATKQALRSSWSNDLATAMSSSFWVTSALFYTDDLKEGVASFLEKREPRFNKKRTDRDRG
ncbi:short-chain-enoyl-CoA hydratase [soil metagenome]